MVSRALFKSEHKILPVFPYLLKVGIGYLRVILSRNCIMTSYATTTIICSRKETKFLPQICNFFARFGTASREILLAACAFREIVKPRKKGRIFLWT